MLYILLLRPRGKLNNGYNSLKVYTFPSCHVFVGIATGVKIIMQKLFSEARLYIITRVMAFPINYVVEFLSY